MFVDGLFDGDLLIVVDSVGVGFGEWVIFISDGKYSWEFL